MKSRRHRPRTIDLAPKGKGVRPVKALVASESLYFWQEKGDVLKVLRQSYEETWRLLSGGFEPDLEDGSGVIVSRSEEPSSLRSLDEKGRVLWEMAECYAAMRVGIDILARRWTSDGRCLLVAFEPKNGAVLGEWPIPVGFNWPLCLSGPRLMCYKDDLVVCHDVRQDRAVWRRTFGPELFGDKVGGIYFSTFDDESVLLNARSLVRCSLADGSVSWTHQPRLNPVKTYRVGGRLLMFQLDVLICLDEVTGEEIFRRQYHHEHDLQLALRESPGALYRNRLAIPFEYGHLIILDTNDGRIVAVHRERHSLWRALEVDGDLLLCTGDGKALIYGPEIWQL